MSTSEARMLGRELIAEADAQMPRSASMMRTDPSPEDRQGLISVHLLLGLATVGLGRRNL